jgi:hypothetical protein
MRRRDFIALTGAAMGLALPVQAQQAKVPKLGILLAGKREPFSKLFWEGMRDFGYIEDRTSRPRCDPPKARWSVCRSSPRNCCG